MKNVLIVGIGGFLGAVLRYKAGGLIMHYFRFSDFPIGTVCVNIAGCFLIGLLSVTIEKLHILGSGSRLILITGFLGGFTTFSAFGYETYFLVKKGAVMLAAVNAGGSLFLGLLAVWIGHVLGSLFL